MVIVWLHSKKYIQNGIAYLRIKDGEQFILAIMISQEWLPAGEMMHLNIREALFKNAHHIFNDDACNTILL